MRSEIHRIICLFYDPVYRLFERMRNGITQLRGGSMGEGQTATTLRSDSGGGNGASPKRVKQRSRRFGQRCRMELTAESDSS